MSKNINTEHFVAREFMHVDEFREIIGGRIFSAKFIKRDGSERTIVARLGVKKHLKGGTLKYDPSARNNLIVFDMQKEEYRTIRFDALKEIKYNNTEVTIDEDV